MIVKTMPDKYMVVPEGTPEWSNFTTSPHAEKYRCELRLVQEDGGFYAYVAQLRGVHSQGDTEQEATQNISDALAAILRSYIENQKEIPWSLPEPKKEEEKTIWTVIKG